MKKKLLLFVCLFTLLFATGCNKEEKFAVPTPTTAPTETSAPTETPTPTPTPIPENLAMANLKKLPEAYSSLLALQPEADVDYSKGLGYDFEMDLAINESVLELLEITGLKSISLDGTMDMKDAFAFDGTLYLNETEVISAELYTDFQNFMFNLPKYSTAYAAATMEELAGTTSEEMPAFNLADFPTNQELYALMENSLNSLIDCFEPQIGIEENLTIGTGEYVMTGEKHTVTVSRENLLAWTDTFEKEFVELLGTEINFDDVVSEEDASAEETFTNFVMHYYTDNNGSYAWELYPDTEADVPLVFVSTPKGFCLYSQEEGTQEVILYSVAASDKTGTITIPGDEETAAVNLNYEFGDNSITLSMADETMEFSMYYAVNNGTVTVDFELIAEGVSFVMKETATTTTADLTISVASFGMEMGSLTMKATLRDYAEITVPQNTTDMETWSAGLDQEALTADLMKLMTDFPFLMDLIMNSGEGEDQGTAPESTYTPPADYTDAFMNMTGYYIDSDGYVDFNPTKDEVLAMGVPSTGFDTIAVTEDQKTALFNFSKSCFEKCDSDSEEFFWVYGDTLDGTVDSYYSVEYTFAEAGNWENYISLEFDAVSGAFHIANIYNPSKDEAFRIANELLKLLNIDYTITQKAAEEYTFENGLSLAAYDGAEYGSNYYYVGFEIYNAE